jgi:hypothetical protein
MTTEERRGTERPSEPAENVLYRAARIILQSPKVMAILVVATFSLASAMYAKLDHRVTRLEGSSEMVESFIASQCLDTLQRSNLRRTQVPCARLLQERGIDPR